jgi:CDP-4-dehydro-6-deoxyglucose reductase
MRARVTLLPAQRIIAVEDDETILGAALRAGVNLPYSCRAGLCSSCRARVTSGAVRYRNGRPPGLMASEAQQGYALLCQALAATEELSVQVREAKPTIETQVQQLPCRVEQLRPLSNDVMAVSLRLPASTLFAFRAGQRIAILLSDHSRCSYALATPPHETAHLELHVARTDHCEFAKLVFAAGNLKTLLRIEGPLGQFWFREESPRPALLIGSGADYASLRSMLRHRLESGDRRPLHLYWAAQTPDGLYEDATVRAWTREYPNLRYTPVVANEGESEQLGHDIAQLQSAVLHDHPVLRDVDVYAAGPAVMLESLHAGLTAQGLPAEQLFLDDSAGFDMLAGEAL